MLGIGGAKPTLAFLLGHIYMRQKKKKSLYYKTEARHGISFPGGCVALSGRGDTLLSLSCSVYKALLGLILQCVCEENIESCR